MYEVLKKKILREGLHKEHSAIEDAFSKICKPLDQVKREFAKIFKYVSAEMMYGHAISLLRHNRDSENKKAVELLEESYKSGHLGSSYLLWTLIYKNKNKSFNFIFADAERYKRCFSNFEEFAKSSVNEIALRMIANEYLKDDSRVVIQDKEKAQKILEEKGYQLIWQEIFGKVDDKQQLSSTQVRTDVLRELNPPIAGSSLSYPKTSTPLQYKDGAEGDLSSLSPEFDRMLSLGNRKSRKRKTDFSESPQLRHGKLPVWDFDQIIVKGVVDGRAMQIKFISDLDNLHSNSKNILQPRTECFFVTKSRGVNKLDPIFRTIEEYCKESQWNNIVQLCRSIAIGSKDSKVILKACYNEGETFFLQGRYADAQRSFCNALKSAKTPEQILLIARSIAGMHAEVDKYSDAIVVLKKAKEDAQEKGLNPSSEVSVLIDNDIRKLSKERLRLLNSHGNISVSSEPDTSIGSIKLEKHMTDFMDFT